jgi:hypothetical protein
VSATGTAPGFHVCRVPDSGACVCLGNVYGETGADAYCLDQTVAASQVTCDLTYLLNCVETQTYIARAQSRATELQLSASVAALVQKCITEAVDKLTTLGCSDAG